MNTSAFHRARNPRNVIAEEAPPAKLGQVIPFSLPEHLLATAIENNAGIELVDRLLALYERDASNQARCQFLEAMVAFKRDCAPSVEKSGYSAEGGYTHATLADAAEHISQHAAAHGLTYDWEYSQEGNRLAVVCVVSHTAGHEKRVTLRATPADNTTPNPAHAIASLVTYFQRYTLLSAFGISTRDKDEEARAVTGLNIEMETHEGQHTPAPVDDSHGAAEAQDLHPAANDASEVSDVIPRDVGVTVHKLAQEKGLPVIPTRVLERNLPTWATMIRTGQKTIQQVFDQVSTLYYVDDHAIKAVMAAAAPQALEAA